MTSVNLFVSTKMHLHLERKMKSIKKANDHYIEGKNTVRVRSGKKVCKDGA